MKSLATPHFHYLINIHNFKDVEFISLWLFVTRVGCKIKIYFSFLDDFSTIKFSVVFAKKKQKKLNYLKENEKSSNKLHITALNQLLSCQAKAM